MRRRLALPVPAGYLTRLEAMAHFAATYTRSDGSSPVWGDADDARALPLGGQTLGDHRYLGVVMAAAWGADVPVSGPRGEAAWLVGPAAAAVPDETRAPGSTLFPDGGVAILRTGSDHVFFDCGPVGLAGRGGHGHNDALSFEAVLDGEPLVVDCGSFVYTASVEWRNRFRSTGSHNTPVVDDEEQNRFHDPPSLWLLRYDAAPETRAWSGESPSLQAAHYGYRRLPSPVVPVRRISLEPAEHRLVVEDEFEGSGDHDLLVPYHLAPGVTARLDSDGVLLLGTEDRAFRLSWNDPAEWTAAIEDAWFSPSYGVRVPAQRVAFRRRGTLRPLAVVLEPVS